MNTLIGLLLLVSTTQSASGQTATTQPSGRAQPEWLTQFVATYDQNRAQLDRLDRRNRKLFGNVAMLSDIDEKDLCARPEHYDVLVRSASQLANEAFPLLQGAFDSNAAECAVNFTSRSVFLRGHEEGCDFAMVVPLPMLTRYDFDGTLLLTVVGGAREGKTRLGAQLVGFVDGTQNGNIRTLEQTLSSLGDISIERILGTRAEGACRIIDAEGLLKRIGVRGQLRISACASVVRLELRDGERLGNRGFKAFRVPIRATGQRIPDWAGERNATPSDSGCTLPPVP